MKRKNYFLIFSTLITCGLLAFIEHGIEINYVIKTVAKVVFFLLNIWIYILIFGGFRWKRFISTQQMNIRMWIRLGLLGAGSASIVFIAYIICQPFIDVTMIKEDLINRLGISGDLFVYVGLYIALGNSFLEEYFFRGFLFFNLPRKWGYIYSPLLFALYHIPMIMLWFSPLLIFLCFIGLWVIGLIFHWVNEGQQTIWSSWVIHICADVMIIGIGFSIFYG